GELPALPSGVTLMLGSNGSRLQPSSPGIWRPVKDWKAPGCSQESPSTLVCSGPVQERGSDRNAGGWDSSSARQGWVGTSPRASPRQSTPRALAGSGSPGTPQKLTTLLRNPIVWVTFSTCTVTPWSPP